MITRVSVCVDTDLHAISMGQGQEVHARRFMGLALANGDWVLLQNCHLSLDYVVEVMDQVNEAETIHDTFRLWVTTEVHPKFPITFLQVSQLICWLLWVVFMQWSCKFRGTQKRLVLCVEWWFGPECVARKIYCYTNATY